MGDKRTGVVFPCLNAYNPQSQIRKVKIFQIKKRRKKEKKMARNEKFLRLGIMDQGYRLKGERFWGRGYRLFHYIYIQVISNGYPAYRIQCEFCLNYNGNLSSRLNGEQKSKDKEFGVSFFSFSRFQVAPIDATGLTVGWVYADQFRLLLLLYIHYIHYTYICRIQWHCLQLLEFNRWYYITDTSSIKKIHLPLITWTSFFFII